MTGHTTAATIDVPSTARRRRGIASGVLRSGIRCVGFALVLAIAAADYVRAFCRGRRTAELGARALWLHRWSRIISRVIGLELDHRGEPPTSGMIVSNHLSYLDILAFSSIAPCIFVAKKEVMGWPVIGLFAKMGGTIFVDRKRRTDVADTNRRIADAMEAGVVVVLFAEGTSSDGRAVLPFRSSLLEPVIDSSYAAAPVAIRYHLDDGSVSEEVCYWRDMTLLPHLLNLFGKRTVRVRLSFEIGTTYSSRKEAARQLHEQVVGLHTTLEKASSHRQ